ncbi:MULTISPECIES: hypothetical protein [Paenibacillus]|uniref:hypothetical protein n=1 Tax=Paenibacillus TaxID=44249 RepID=UPI0022B8FA9F|nr:hypothetical protein [Paenibacillus caseinilyticus]MCZ8520169.1 hypothetical protein [Paenibacillus caseinilyticus]
MTRSLTQSGLALLALLILFVYSSFTPTPLHAAPFKDHLQTYASPVPEFLPVKPCTLKWSPVLKGAPQPFKERMVHGADGAELLWPLLLRRSDVRKRLKARLLSPLKFTSVYVA